MTQVTFPAKDFEQNDNLKSPRMGNENIDDNRSKKTSLSVVFNNNGLDASGKKQSMTY